MKPGQIVVVGFAVAAALAGSALGLHDVTSGTGTSSLHPVGESVRTSFGIVAVEHVSVLTGLPADALGGQTHGVRGLVSDAKASVQAFVTLTNESNGVVPYSPGQFRLRAGATNLAATTAMLQPGTLQPQANIDARMQFVVPRDGERLQLEFRDRDGSSVLIDLGSADKAPPGAGAGSH